MKHLHFLGIAIALTLGGCALRDYYPASDTTANTPSGITVYGEIDASVVHTR